MRQSILHVALVVHDYDEAIRFFCEKLHFRLVEDTYQPEQDKRWVVVAPPGARGTTLLLARASNPEQAAFIGRQTGGRVFLFLSTDDFWRDYNDMLAAGIHFVREPKEAPYGTVAVFADLYGNLWDLIQPREADGSGHKMELLELIQRQVVPSPWSEGEKIPWNDPEFSQRMLAEHLSQAHDLASRRSETIDRHVQWIHRTVLAVKPAKILDLGCGPGLYTSRLAVLGHTCVGIDFSPASIAYANETARENKLSCSYVQQDVRSTDFGADYDLVMFIFGELNVFRPAEARLILQKAHQALKDDGRLLLEVHTFDAVLAIGEQPCSWYSSQGGLFSDRAHICMLENFWDAEQNVATERYFILDAEAASMTRYASSTQAYTDDQYRTLLQEYGFRDVQFHPSLHGKPDESQAGLFVITARK